VCSILEVVVQSRAEPPDKVVDAERRRGEPIGRCVTNPTQSSDSMAIETKNRNVSVATGFVSRVN